MKTTLTLSLAAGLAAVSLHVSAYPAPYAVDASTPEKRAALIERLYHQHDTSRDVKIFPEGKVPFKANDKPFLFKEHELAQSNVVISDINIPQFTFFPASGAGAKGVVVVLPGGGYWQLGWNKEGVEIAEWLNSIGYSAAVLLYRAPNQRQAALCDVQRTIRILRHDAGKYSIRPDRIGVIGFSAGANLAIRAATCWRKSEYERIDEIDDVSCRPDFQMPVYPWDILGNWEKIPANGADGKLDLTLKAEYPVDAETPPAFITQTQDDFCKPETSVAYYLALRRANVPVEMHLYPCGGHGYGKRALGAPCDYWSEAAAHWLEKLK